MAKCFDRCSCAEIGSADTDHDQYIGIALDLLCCLLDTIELILVVIYGKVDPSEEIISLAGLLKKCLLRCYNAILDRCHVSGRRHKFGIAKVKLNCLCHNKLSSLYYEISKHTF